MLLCILFLYQSSSSTCFIFILTSKKGVRRPPLITSVSGSHTHLFLLDNKLSDQCFFHSSSFSRCHLLSFLNTLLRLLYIHLLPSSSSSKNVFIINYWLPISILQDQNIFTGTDFGEHQQTIKKIIHASKVSYLSYPIGHFRFINSHYFYSICQKKVGQVGHLYIL